MPIRKSQCTCLFHFGRLPLTPRAAAAVRLCSWGGTWTRRRTCGVRTCLTARCWAHRRRSPPPAGQATRAGPGGATRPSTSSVCSRPGSTGAIGRQAASQAGRYDRQAGCGEALRFSSTFSKVLPAAVWVACDQTPFYCCRSLTLHFRLHAHLPEPMGIKCRVIDPSYTSKWKIKLKTEKMIVKQTWKLWLKYQTQVPKRFGSSRLHELHMSQNFRLFRIKLLDFEFIVLETYQFIRPKLPFNFLM